MDNMALEIYACCPEELPASGTGGVYWEEKSPGLLHVEGDPFAVLHWVEDHWGEGEVEGMLSTIFDQALRGVAVLPASRLNPPPEDALGEVQPKEFSLYDETVNLSLKPLTSDVDSSVEFVCDIHGSVEQDHDCPRVGVVVISDEGVFSGTLTADDQGDIIEMQIRPSSIVDELSPYEMNKMADRIQSLIEWGCSPYEARIRAENEFEAILNETLDFDTFTFPIPPAPDAEKWVQEVANELDLEADLHIDEVPEMVRGLNEDASAEKLALSGAAGERAKTTAETAISPELELVSEGFVSDSLEDLQYDLECRGYDTQFLFHDVLQATHGASGARFRILQSTEDPSIGKESN